MPRLFTSVPLPTAIADQLARFREPLPGARWLDPADYHITLCFAGDIDNRTADELAHSLARIEAYGFDLTLKGFGVFGGGDPRLLWAGIAPSPLLERLYQANERAARAAGLQPQRRAFKPHVTVARLRHARRDPIARFLQRHAVAESAPFEVDRFHLMSSKPHKGGGPYVIEQTFPLIGVLPDGEFGGAGDDWDSWSNTH